MRSVRSDQSVARVFRTGSGQNGPARGSELLSSPAPVGQSAGIWRVVAGKIYARALDLSVSTGLNQFFSAGQNGQMEGNVSFFLSHRVLSKSCILRLLLH